MKNILHMTALSLALTSGTVLAAEEQTGITALTVADARSDRPLEGFL